MIKGLQTPHDELLADFSADVQALYDLDGSEAEAIREAVGAMLNAAAANALARRPRWSERQVVAKEGLQEGPEFMRPDEVSAALGVPLATLAAWRYRSSGPAFRKNGRAVYYRREDVRDWIARQANEALQPAQEQYTLGQALPIEPTSPGSGGVAVPIPSEELYRRWREQQEASLQLPARDSLGPVDAAQDPSEARP